MNYLHRCVVEIWVHWAFIVWYLRRKSYIEAGSMWDAEYITAPFLRRVKAGGLGVDRSRQYFFRVVKPWMWTLQASFPKPCYFAFLLSLSLAGAVNCVFKSPQLLTCIFLFASSICFNYSSVLRSLLRSVTSNISLPFFLPFNHLSSTL